MVDEVQDVPLVSVIMSFHNARDTLVRSIRSLLWQTYPNWELILLDDGSTDGSTKASKLIKDPRIQLYGDSVCRGLPARLNQGVLLAKGQYIARMDADDIAFPERFARQVAYLQNHPDVDLLATSALLVNEEGRPKGLLVAGLSHDEICRRPWLGFPMPHPTWMGRAEWFRQNPYDDLARKAQDQALLLQTYAKSQFASLPDILLGYRYGSVSLEKSITGRWNYIRTVCNNRQNTMDFPLVAKTLLYHAAAALRDVFGLMFGLGSAILDARVNKAGDGILSEWRDLQNRLKGGCE